MLNYLFELRRRALIVLFCFIAFFSVFFIYANELFYFIIKPLFLVLPAQSSLIATQITAPVFIPIMLAADIALLCTAPVALFQLWQFITPALYHRERYQFKFLILSSSGLFLLGGMFCFYIVLPLMFQFFTHSIPLGVKMMPDMNYTLNFITRMLLVFGFCFQVPLVCWLSVRLGWLNTLLLKQIRPYIIVVAFTLGMLLTPPDVLSQILLAVPLCLLYELGIIFSYWAEKNTGISPSAAGDNY